MAVAGTRISVLFCSLPQCMKAMVRIITRNDLEHIILQLKKKKTIWDSNQRLKSM